jgi:hypothetical protein
MGGVLRGWQEGALAPLAWQNNMFVEENDIFFVFCLMSFFPFYDSYKTVLLLFSLKNYNYSL